MRFFAIALLPPHCISNHPWLIQGQEKAPRGVRCVESFPMFAILGVPQPKSSPFPSAEVSMLYMRQLTTEFNVLAVRRAVLGVLPDLAGVSAALL